MSFDEEKFHKHVQRLFTKPADQLGRALHATFGIAGEAGEIVDMMKKVWIYEKTLDKENLVEECGDILFYVAALLDEYGYKLSDAAEHNYAKLQKRYPNGYTNEAALTRADKL